MFRELVATSPAQRNWRGILIALLVIVAVLGLIMFSIVLLSPPDEGPRVRGDKFSLRDITEPMFRPAPFNGTWISVYCHDCHPRSRVSQR
ncbi:hypothetical protein FOCC_FOCC013736 [Frankliniella occidentalis]|nr:hypothetical protein FOCC_FOCC013736 [Frankliniella occidentalis]